MVDDNFNIAQGFSLKKVSLKNLANLVHGELVGQDIEIGFLVRLKTRKSKSIAHLTYVTDQSYLESFIASSHEAAIIPLKLFHLLDVSNTPKSFLVVDKSADTAFFELHELLSQNDFYPKITSYRGNNCNIHSSAVIFDNVRIKDNVIIHPNVVVYPNSIIDDNVEIKPSAVIGGIGFEKKYLFGKNKIVAHTGGIYLGKNVSIGASTSVDRGEMGDFTQIYNDTKVDNLVHIAHNVIVGSDSFIIACSEISGSCIFGKGIWYAPGACCNPEIILGDYTFVGTGAVVVKDTLPFSLVYGNPAKQGGWMCKCQKYRISLVNDYAICNCGRKYRYDGKRMNLIEDII